MRSEGIRLLFLMKKDAVTKKSGKKIILIVSAALLAFITVYLVLVCIPYRGKLTVSDDVKNSFSAEAFYSDTVGKERVMLLEDAGAAFLHRIDVIQKAQNTILFSTFLFFQGDSSDIFTGALLDAADRGVEVFVLIDKWADIPISYQNCFISNRNIHFYIFNPLNFLSPGYLNASFHDKCLIVDDSYYIIGGRNISDTYFYEDSPYFQSDLDVLIFNTDTAYKGALCQGQEYYHDMLNSPLTRSYTALPEKNAAQALADARLYADSFRKFKERSLDGKEIIYSDLTIPANRITLITNHSNDGTRKEPVIAWTLWNLAKDSETIIMHSPFVVLTKNDFSLFSDAVRGKNVTLITNSIAASHDPYSFSNYYINRKKYLDLGVNLYEYQSVNASLHDKCYVFDDRLTVIGSFNLDERSIRVDTESMVIIDSPEFNAATKTMLQDNMDQCLLVDADTNEYIANSGVEPSKSSWSKRFIYVFLGHVMSLIDYLL